MWISEGCRQALLSTILLFSLLGVQAGLLLLALAAYLRPRLDEHSVALGGAVLPREQWMLTGSGGAVLLTSALGLLWVSAARVRGKTRRRDALMLGWFYLTLEAAAAAVLVTLAVMLEIRLWGFQLTYHRGLARALWRYRNSSKIKAYVDRTQSRYQCCGTIGFSDWFVVDWYPIELYVARYLKSVELRDMFAEEGGRQGNELRASFKMTKYGSQQHAQLVQDAIDDERRTQELNNDLLAAKLRLGFNEVPFSCCDPSSALWCHQADVARPSVGYTPPANLTIFTTGCSSRVPGFFTWYLFIASRASLGVAGFKLVVVLLARYCQSSMSNALAAGRHLSSAPGWIVPLCQKDADEGDDEETEKLIGSTEEDIEEEEDVAEDEMGASTGTDETGASDGDTGTTDDETDTEGETTDTEEGTTEGDEYDEEEGDEDEEGEED